MSRLYRMEVEISDYNAERENQIVDAANGEWPEFAPNWVVTGDFELRSDGEDSLTCGEGGDEFATRLAAAIMEANGAPCRVHVESVYLECEPPSDDFTFDEDDYERLTQSPFPPQKSVEEDYLDPVMLEPASGEFEEETHFEDIRTEVGMTDAQIERQDIVDDIVFRALNELAGRDPDVDPLDWDMALIGEIREAFEWAICNQLKLMTVMDFYPYIEDKDEAVQGMDSC